MNWNYVRGKNKQTKRKQTKKINKKKNLKSFYTTVWFCI